MLLLLLLLHAPQALADGRMALSTPSANGAKAPLASAQTDAGDQKQAGADEANDVAEEELMIEMYPLTLSCESRNPTRKVPITCSRTGTRRMRVLDHRPLRCTSTAVVPCWYCFN